MGFKNCVATQSPPITLKTIIFWLASLLSKIATIRILYLLVGSVTYKLSTVITIINKVNAIVIEVNQIYGTHV
jgi:hypothetical protein